jgi:hypothetical protein
MNRSVVVMAVALGVVLAGGCSSSSSPGGGNGSGNGAGGGMVLVCDESTIATVNQCTKTTGLPASLYSATESMCTQQGGKVVSSCPTSGVIGCCTNGDSEGCFYTGGTSPMTQAQCTMVGGTWSASP